MEEKTKAKFKKIRKIILFICLIIILITGLYIKHLNNNSNIKYDGKYQTIYNSNDSKINLFKNDDETYEIINNYSDYMAIIEEATNQGFNNATDMYDSSFFENNSLIFTVYTVKSKFTPIYKILSVNEHKKNVNITIYTSTEDDLVANNQYQSVICFIPISKDIASANITYTYSYISTNTYEQIEIGNMIIGISIFSIIMTFIKEKENETKKSYIKRKTLIVIISFLIIGSLVFGYYIYEASQSTIVKPIIYLYPEQETNVSVNLGYPNKITVSYPKYVNQWNVLADKSGSLIDLTTNKNLYSLYYESDPVYNFKVEEDGFIVKAEEVQSFLEEKLSILGLNEREAEEFIIYWLPILQENKYNYIRFATTEEINKNMPLTINPNPDTLIRILITYKPLNAPINVKEQRLITPERKGYVAVEWGGTKIN